MKIFAFALLFGVQLFGAHFITFQVPDCPGTAPTAINNNGVVVGICSDQGFIRDASGHFTRLPGLFPAAINIHGVITGTGGGSFGGFVREPQGTITTLPPQATIPIAINASGQIVGTAIEGASPPQAFLLEPDGTLTIFIPQVHKGAVATGINEIGEITGAAFQGISDLAQGFIRSPNGVTTQIGPVNTEEVWGLDINRAGTVIGIANAQIPPLGVWQTQGFIQTATGAPVLFPMQSVTPIVLPYRPYVNGGINAKGFAVIQNLYVYVRPDGTVSITKIELGPCGDVSAQAINDIGWVTGSCTVPGHPPSGFLWRK
jgi:hypothetical protein